MSKHLPLDVRVAIEADNEAIVRDESLCIKCGQCKTVCQEKISIHGFYSLEDTNDTAICIHCGQCANVCPINSIHERYEYEKVKECIKDDEKIVIVSTSPSVRVSLGEAFQMEPGSFVEGKMVALLRKLGFDYVLDTNFAADLTIMEEANELVERIRNQGVLPQFTSCCPAWVKYLENENPKYLKNISTCKSPMEMVGAIFRDKYAAKDAADGRTTYHIAIMPCTAKKMEAARPEFVHDGRPDVDLVLTTREVIDMMQETGIQLSELELESPDMPFGLGSGAAIIYGTSGGVAEAVVRHCLPDKSKNALREISILGLRGDAPIKEASVTVGDAELKIAVVNGLANAKKLLKDIDEGKAFYHLIEVMTCQGGCVGGAGQPYGLKATKEKRGDGLHQSDNAAMFKRAERNPIVVRMMAEYGEERCHELLHVSYRGE